MAAVSKPILLAAPSTLDSNSTSDLSGGAADFLDVIATPGGAGRD